MEESIPKRFENPIEVAPVVLDGLEAVRKSGETNMLDCAKVQAMAALMYYPETALWIQEHQREYSEGIFRGLVAYKVD